MQLSGGVSGKPTTRSGIVFPGVSVGKLGTAGRGSRKTTAGTHGPGKGVVCLPATTPCHTLSTGVVGLPPTTDVRAWGKNVVAFPTTTDIRGRKRL